MRRRNSTDSSKEKKRKNIDGVRPGDHGVYLTCEKDLEKRAAREVLELFTKYVDEEPTNEAKAIDISKAVKAEVAEIKKKTSSLFHIKHVTGVHGTSFLLFDQKAPNPTELVLQVMKDVYENGESMFKTCIKVLPFTHCCTATSEEMKQLAETILPEHFPQGEDAPSFQFAVHAEKHCASDQSLHTKELIKIFADSINGRHQVNLTHPEKVILVSIIKSICCVAIVDGVSYEKYGKFNVRQCLEKHIEDGGKRKAEDTGREAGVKKVNSEGEMRVGVEAL